MKSAEFLEAYRQGEMAAMEATGTALGEAFHAITRKFSNKLTAKDEQFIILEGQGVGIRALMIINEKRKAAGLPPCPDVK